ncbi:unnamed protein product [Closterium sp. NIES-64]|nr:unnamed protein product [Closterium sp. NIES-64]
MLPSPIHPRYKNPPPNTQSLSPQASFTFQLLLFPTVFQNPANLKGPRGFILLQPSDSLDAQINGHVADSDLPAPVLTSLRLHADSALSVRSLTWSPLLPHSILQRGCQLAVCSTDGRLRVFRAPVQEAGSKWIQVADLSVTLTAHLRDTWQSQTRGNNEKVTRGSDEKVTCGSDGRLPRSRDDKETRGAQVDKSNGRDGSIAGGTGGKRTRGSNQSEQRSLAWSPLVTLTWQVNQQRTNQEEGEKEAGKQGEAKQAGGRQGDGKEGHGIAVTFSCLASGSQSGHISLWLLPSVWEGHSPHSLPPTLPLPPPPSASHLNGSWALLRSLRAHPGRWITALTWLDDGACGCDDVAREKMERGSKGRNSCSSSSSSNSSSGSSGSSVRLLLVSGASDGSVTVWQVTFSLTSLLSQPTPTAAKADLHPSHGPPAHMSAALRTKITPLSKARQVVAWWVQWGDGWGRVGQRDGSGGQSRGEGGQMGSGAGAAETNRESAEVVGEVGERGKRKETGGMGGCVTVGGWADAHAAAVTGVVVVLRGMGLAALYSCSQVDSIKCWSVNPPPTFYTSLCSAFSSSLSSALPSSPPSSPPSDFLPLRPLPLPRLSSALPLTLSEGSDDPTTQASRTDPSDFVGCHGLACSPNRLVIATVSPPHQSVTSTSRVQRRLLRHLKSQSPPPDD